MNSMALALRTTTLSLTDNVSAEVRAGKQLLNSMGRVLRNRHGDARREETEQSESDLIRIK